MELEYQNSKQDFIDFYRTFIVLKFYRWLTSLVIVLVFLMFCLAEERSGWQIYLYAIVTYGVIVLITFFLIPYLSLVKKLNKIIADEIDFTEKRKLIVTDEGIKTIGAGFDNLKRWDTVISIDSNEKVIYIKLVDNRVFLLSRRSFPNADDVANFLVLVRSKITEPTNTTTHIPNKPPVYKPFKNPYRSNPPYLLGLLGFIPLVGAFVGIGLILYGIIKYRDKWLVIIGAAGILFTVFVYGSMFYTMRPGNKLFDQGFAAIDTVELNGLVKEIEFYKMQNGTYPDSLGQLDTKESLTSTSDPILIASGKKNDKFNYQKIGSKYTLFSSGIDQKPNTKDDIYPTLNIDTNKMGLLKPKVGL